MNFKNTLGGMLAAIALMLSSTPAMAQEAQVAESTQQIDCLAVNAYHEARGEPRTGQIAVMNVVMNRARDGRFPRTPCGVIYQRNNRGCQFSWVCSGGGRAISNRIYDELRSVARQVYNGSIADNTLGAIYFHARSISPSWARAARRTITIGAHSFYRG